MEVFKRFAFDKVLLVNTLLLLILGIIMVFSSSAILAGEKYRQSFYFLTNQIIAAVFGLVLMVIVASVREPFFTMTRLIYLATALTFLLLVLCLFMPPSANTTAGFSLWECGFNRRSWPRSS